MAKSGNKEQTGLRQHLPRVATAQGNGHIRRRARPGARRDCRSRGASPAKGRPRKRCWTRSHGPGGPPKISGAAGEVVFKMDDAEVPADWSQLATDGRGQQVLPQGRRPSGKRGRRVGRQLVPARRAYPAAARARRRAATFGHRPADAGGLRAE